MNKKQTVAQWAAKEKARLNPFSIEDLAEQMFPKSNNGNLVHDTEMRFSRKVAIQIYNRLKELGKIKE